jgi:hypothetical protein
MPKGYSSGTAEFHDETNSHSQPLKTHFASAHTQSVATNIRNDSPFFEQPFWDVTTMIVTLTPTSELIRAEIGLFGEAQTKRQRFKLGRYWWWNCL